MNTPSFLYIEDNEANRSVMQMIIRDVMGYDLALIDDPSKLTSKLTTYTNPFSIIFTDMRMKPIDGFEVCQIIRQHDLFGTCPVIGLISHVTAQDMHRMKEVGFNGVIMKPIDLRFFPDQINKLMDGTEIWDG